jgi:hypothetical protein
MEDYEIGSVAAEWNPQGKRSAEDQSTYGRMELETACKEETSRINNV